MDSTEKFCLKRNDFQTRLSSSFQDMRNYQEFTDVTLVCGDNQRIEAHKVVLASASGLFKSLLTENKHPHPVIFLMGINANNITSIINFVYHGEANVLQRDLESFLTLAEELGLKGLTRLQEVMYSPAEETTHNQVTNPNHCKEPDIEQYESRSRIEEEEHISLFELTSNLVDESTIQEAKTKVSYIEHDELDEKINTMLEKVDGIWACSMCGKVAKNNRKDNIRKHIETHIKGVSHICELCDKICSTRANFQVHMARIHQQ